MARGLASSRHAPPGWHSHAAHDAPPPPPPPPPAAAAAAAPVSSKLPTVASTSPAPEPEPAHQQSHHRPHHRGPRHKLDHHQQPSSSTVANTTTTITPDTTTALSSGPITGSGPAPVAGAGAQPSPAPTSTARSAPHHELARYTKIMRRLQWKLPFLAQGYRLAVDHRLGGDPIAVAEAELMFKLDFFEYYMLIERALVHLLGVFGVEVTRGGPIPPTAAGGGGGGQQHEGGGTGEGGGRRNSHPSLSASRWGDAKRSRHRYHANVLAALDNPENPLHAALGTGEVRVQLGRAKDLRNRWKTAGDEEEEEAQPDAGKKAKEETKGTNSRRGSQSPTKRTTTTTTNTNAPGSPEWRPTKKVAAPLDSYRLEHMLEVIFAGLGEAFKIAEARVRSAVRWGDEDDEEMLEALDWTAATEDEKQWEFMVDAMDWEAV
ncbi:hypothetical protein VTJ49DRAFT_4245 [Mycothermus thermophilus]|uniref:Uncharacterized protein n=1 Tax=Humicola insolens TaxID=85995 RepID=A0ABR3VLI1_HUMIN